MENNFKCRANKAGYCNLWLRDCVGGENCKQGYCAYCIYSSPKTRTECEKCKQYDWKKENYVE